MLCKIVFGGKKDRVCVAVRASPPRTGAPSRVRIAWQCVWVAVLALLWQPGLHAQYYGTTTFIPAISALNWSGVPNQSQTLYTGNLVYQATFPALASYGQSNFVYGLYTSFGTSSAGISIAGYGATKTNLYLTSTGSPTISGCQKAGLLASLSTEYIFAWNPNTTGSCSINISIPVQISVQATTVANVPTSAGGNTPVTSYYGISCGTYGVNSNGIMFTLYNPTETANCTNGPPTVYVAPFPTLTVNMINCTLSTSNLGVNLPSVLTNSLSSAGEVAGSSSFNLSFTGCNNSYTTPVVGSATWSFTQGGASNIISTGVPHLGVQLLCGPSGSTPTTAITNGGSTSLLTVPGNASNTTISANCIAQYIADGGAASAGSFTAAVTYTMTYQ